MRLVSNLGWFYELASPQRAGDQETWTLPGNFSAALNLCFGFRTPFWDVQCDLGRSRLRV